MRFFEILYSRREFTNTPQVTRASGMVMKENATRKLTHLPHGFSLWQVKADGSSGFSQISLKMLKRR